MLDNELKPTQEPDLFDWKELEKYEYSWELNALHYYLATMEEFLDTQARLHEDSLKSMKQNIELGEIKPPIDPHQMPDEMSYDYFMLDLIGEYENTLRKSFFVTVYTLLEARLINECRRRAELVNQKPPIDFGGNAVNKAMAYLIKRHINSSVKKSGEWKNEIEPYHLLRNCLIHNQGRIRAHMTHARELKDYVERKQPILQLLHDKNLGCDEIFIHKGFCEQVIETISRFLMSVRFSTR